MAHPFQIKKDMLLPPITGTIQSEETGEPFNLSLASNILFTMRASGVVGAVATGFATYIASSHSASGAGYVAYYLASGQSATINWYQAEFQVQLAGSRRLTVPPEGFISVRVNERI